MADDDTDEAVDTEAEEAAADEAAESTLKEQFAAELDGSDLATFQAMLGNAREVAVALFAVDELRRAYDDLGLHNSTETVYIYLPRQHDPRTNFNSRSMNAWNPGFSSYAQFCLIFAYSARNLRELNEVHEFLRKAWKLKWGGVSEFTFQPKHYKHLVQDAKGSTDWSGLARQVGGSLGRSIMKGLENKGAKSKGKAKPKKS